MLQNVEYAIDVDYDDTPVYGNAMASGNDSIDQEVCDSIHERLDQGDVWAWCVVKVTASWEDVHGVDYLGGCCYHDEDDFKKCGYYEDMCAEALAELELQVERIIRAYNDAPGTTTTH